jgi:hypothetical protein
MIESFIEWLSYSSTHLGYLANAIDLIYLIAHFFKFDLDFTFLDVIREISYIPILPSPKPTFSLCNEDEKRMLIFL